MIQAGSGYGSGGYAQARNAAPYDPQRDWNEWQSPQLNQLDEQINNCRARRKAAILRAWKASA